MSFKSCPICKNYGFFDISSSDLQHKCPPKFECCLESNGEEWEDIYANDHEDAAEKFAERYDSSGGDYSIVNGRHDKVIVLVRRSDEDPVQRFNIEAEMVANYHARELP